MNSPIRVLHVEDDSFDRERVREVLSQAGGFSVVETEKQRDFERLLAAEEWDCVLTDLQLSGYTGFDVLDRVRGLHPETPVVFLTGTGSEEYAVEAMKRGAADYILKAPSHYGKLPLALRNAVAAQRAREDKLRAEKALERSAAAYRQLFQSNPHPMWVYDLETLAFIEVNDATVSKYGWSREEFLRMTLHDIRLAEEVPQALDAGAMVKAERGGAGVWCHRTRDGAQLYMEVVSHVIDWQGRRAEVALANDVTERIRVEEEVREALGELNTIYQATPAGIALVSNRNLLRANAAFAEIVGRGREALIWMDTVGLFLSEEDARRYWDLAEPQLASQGRYACERQLRRADGALRWVRLTAQAIDRAAAWKGMVWVAEDLEEARRTGQESRKLAEYLAESQRIGHMGSWSLDPATGRLTWSAEQYRLFGMDPAGPAPNIDEFLDLVHEEDRAALRATVAGCLERGESRELEFRIRPRSGGERWVRGSIHAERDAEGRVVRAYGVKRDITEEKRAQEQICRSRDFYLTLFEEFPTLIWRSTPDGESSYFNRTWLDFTGRSLEQERKGGWAEGVHPDDRARCLETYTSHFQARKPYEMEYRLRHVSGEHRWIREIGRPFVDMDGEFGGFIGTGVDLTDRVRAEERLRQTSEALAEAQRIGLMGSWSLDLTTGTITWSAEQFRLFGQDPSGPEPEYQRFLELIHPEDRSALASAQERLVATGETVELEFRTVSSGGEVRWLHAIARAERGAEGRVVRAFGINRDVTEEKRVRDDIRRSRDFYLTLFEKFPTMVWQTGPDGGCNFVNRAWVDFTGVPTDSALGNGWQEWMHPEDRARELAGFAEAFKARKPVQAEYRLRHAGGDYRWVHDFGGPYYDLDGKFAGYIGTCVDVTERRLAVQRLEESEERLREIVQNMPVMLDAFDEQGRIIAWNAECARVTGYTAEEIVGNRGAMELLYPDAEYRERMLKEWQSRGHFYRGWEWRLTAKDGTERAVLWSNQSEQYRVPGWTTWGVGVDVTEHRRVEQSLHAAEHRFRTLVNQAADCMFITDLEGRILDCNEATCERLGYTREELLAMNLSQIDPVAAALPPDELRRLHASTIDRKLVFEGVHRRRDGSSYPVEVRIAGVRLSGKEYVIGLARDVTERRRAEQALRESEERFRALIETATDFIAILGADGLVKYVSPSLTNVLGHLPQDVLAHNYLEFVHPDDVARASAALASLAAQPRGVTKIEVRVRTSEGAFRRLDVVARNVLDLPSIDGVVVTARDLTGRVVPA